MPNNLGQREREAITAPNPTILQLLHHAFILANETISKGAKLFHHYQQHVFFAAKHFNTLNIQFQTEAT